MEQEFTLMLCALQSPATLAQLQQCNAVSAHFGLELSQTQMENLTKHRFRVLQETGRVEFGEGILPKMIHTFCDSPYLSPRNYEETLLALQECFYHLKGKVGFRLADDELLMAMRFIFDGKAGGDALCVADATPEHLYRCAQAGREVQEEAVEGCLEEMNAE